MHLHHEIIKKVLVIKSLFSNVISQNSSFTSPNFIQFGRLSPREIYYDKLFPSPNSNEEIMDIEQVMKLMLSH